MAWTRAGEERLTISCWEENEDVGSDVCVSVVVSVDAVELVDGVNDSFRRLFLRKGWAEIMSLDSKSGWMILSITSAKSRRLTPILCLKPPSTISEGRLAPLVNLKLELKSCICCLYCLSEGQFEICVDRWLPSALQFWKYIKCNLEYNMLNLVCVSFFSKKYHFSIEHVLWYSRKLAHFGPVVRILFFQHTRAKNKMFFYISVSTRGGEGRQYQFWRLHLYNIGRYIYRLRSSTPN